MQFTTSLQHTSGNCKYMMYLSCAQTGETPIFQAVNKREYMLAANHKEEMDEWLAEIRKCMEEDQGSTSQR